MRSRGGIFSEVTGDKTLIRFTTKEAGFTAENAEAEFYSFYPLRTLAASAVKSLKLRPLQ